MKPAGPSKSLSGVAEYIEQAAQRLDGVVRTTPLEHSVRVSDRVDAQVWLKREDLQSVRSYKVRGAYNFIAQLDDLQRAKGVVTASAGNHAQGVAFACARLGIRGRIHLPSVTPRQKRERIRAIGGDMVQIVIGAETYDDVSKAAAAEAAETGATLVPAFDHEAIVAGQGTVIREIVDQLGEAPDVVVVPVGGGGLLAGTVAWLATNYPSVRVVGVEPAGAPNVAAALAAGEPVILDHIDTFVDGAAVRRAGDFTTHVISQAQVEMIAEPEGSVCSEMLELYQVEGIIAEPAGALATAALVGGGVPIAPGQRVVCVVSGGNNDVSRYAEVVERALVHEGRKHYFLVDFPQEPGALRHFLDEVLGPDDDITLFEYVKRSNKETGPALVGIELANAEDLTDLLRRMEVAPARIEKIDSDSPWFRFLL